MHLSEKKAKWKSKKGPFVPNDTTYWFLSPFSCKMAGFPAKGASAYQLAALLRFPAVQTYVVESGAKWSWAPCIFYLLHFLRSHHHLNVFHICLFSLWFHSSGAAQKTRESLLLLVTPKIEIFLKSEKNPSWESPISTMMMRNSCVTHSIDRLLTSCHLRTLAYLTDFLFLARLVQVMAQIK